ncbi:MAG: hypothetical protein QS2022_0490 [Candidatus Phytoplasma asteris]|uniref:Uncharacterized protein n=2 Tax=16SrI (Aster yellows group) TaxID=3042590 RepID=Q6YRI3_ONYPE|nr:hypothetical protein ['Chrysanthemum coronarium' phytoplasma]TKA88240.1 MAG: hypothetical protein PLY_0490 [Periwinkle leaf yellowing phytoplasma]WEX19339.1 MAG: hypothetical protein QS2022_0490 [Candidatus Phytoplasma asteris]BAD04117.1 conserved hypothetical protein [Onion yellows phytoplasma OY-M]GAK73629.1 ATP-dependent DNA ligase ['Chrysanthemum coronarium' phytoplasma]
MQNIPNSFKELVQEEQKTLKSEIRDLIGKSISTHENNDELTDEERKQHEQYKKNKKESESKLSNKEWGFEVLDSLLNGNNYDNMSSIDSQFNKLKSVLESCSQTYYFDPKTLSSAQDNFVETIKTFKNNYSKHNSECQGFINKINSLVEEFKAIQERIINNIIMLRKKFEYRFFYIAKQKLKFYKQEVQKHLQQIKKELQAFKEQTIPLKQYCNQL